jgi:hypothetical protein
VALVKSRYGSLRVLFTLALILGIAGALAAWFGLGGLLDDIAVGIRWIAWFGVVPTLLWGILGFLQFFVIGKVLHLLVDLDETTLTTNQTVAEQLRHALEAPQPAATVAVPPPSTTVTAPVETLPPPAEATPIETPAAPPAETEEPA